MSRIQAALASGLNIIYSREVEDSSRMSSPLTSLSSLDDESIPPLSISADSSLYTLDDVRFAEVSLIS